ncbi:2-hydroxyglutaryl-CoA dehydratase [Sesbania bispinosa]|nr:2-hydroxyglutaryl-CoA dehydratase [Sesbania bispinosa]
MNHHRRGRREWRQQKNESRRPEIWFIGHGARQRICFRSVAWQGSRFGPENALQGGTARVASGQGNRCGEGTIETNRRVEELDEGKTMLKVA